MLSMMFFLVREDIFGVERDVGGVEKG